MAVHTYRAGSTEIPIVCTNLCAQSIILQVELNRGLRKSVCVNDNRYKGVGDMPI